MSEIDQSEITDEDFPENVSITSSMAEGGSRFSHHRAEVERKREAKKREEEENLTFKPKLYEFKSTGDKQDGGGKSRFDKLYEHARKKQLQATSPEDAPPSPELTFHPTLVARSSSRSKRDESPAERVNRMYNAKGSGNNSVDVVEKPSFQPTISKRASSVERRQGDVAERLFQKSIQMKEKLEKIQQEEAERVPDECTFTPSLNTTSRSLSATRNRKTGAADVAERLRKAEEDKANRLEELRRAKQAREDAEATFKPNLIPSKRSPTPTRLNGGSSVLSSSGGSTSSKNVYERLSGASEHFSSSASTMTMDSEHTFRPTIPKASRDMTVRSLNL